MTPEAASSSNPGDDDAPAPYAPYGQSQPFDGVASDPVPHDWVPSAPPYGGVPSAVMHPMASTAMTLGIVSFGAIFLCGVPLLLAPLAWFLGARVIREIDADPLRFAGRERAYTGRVMGMTGTALLLLVIVMLFGSDFGSDSDSDSDTDEGTGSTSYYDEF